MITEPSVITGIEEWMGYFHEFVGRDNYMYGQVNMATVKKK